MSDRVVLRSPAQVVATVPALVGFQPADSLVILYLSTQSDTLACTLRLDLDTPTTEVLRVLHDVAAQAGEGRLLLVAYPNTLAEWIDSAAEDRLLDLDRQLAAAGIHVSDGLIVCEGRWWSMLCTDPGCCPAGGTPLEDTVPELEVQLVHAGQVSVAPSRDDVVARFQLRPDLVPDDVALATAEDALPEPLSARCDRVLELLAMLTAPAAETGAALRAEVAWLLQDVNVRDWALAHVCADDVDHVGVEVLVQLALTAPDGLRPRVAGAAAAALHAAGGSSVGVRALIDHANGDSLAGLVEVALDHCMPPTALQDVFTEALPALEHRINADIPA